MKTFLTVQTISLILAAFIIPSAFAGDASYPPAWAYDEGPMLTDADRASNCEGFTSMGCELLSIKQSIPYFPEVATGAMHKRERGGSQKFRPAFGDIPWRMLQKPNSVKILFIGQDGTHIAEAAGRPATAGFGGRAHDLANYFGVDYSAGFINTYAFTIKGQASARFTPYLYNCESASSCQLRYANLVNNGLWLVSQDQDSPITKWRNRLIDWIIRNNRQSLKMIVSFGGSARDSIASFVISKGGEVDAKVPWSELKRIKIAETELAYAGGNNQFPVPLDKNGEDLYPQILGYKPDYVVARDTGKSEGQEAARKALERGMSSGQTLQFVLDKIFVTNGGAHGSGLFHPAQLEGFDLSRISINGKQTRSLKGIKLDDSTTLQNDIVVLELPHPNYLTQQKRKADKAYRENMDLPLELRKPNIRKGQEVVREMVANAASVLYPYMDKGWTIAEDARRPELQNKPYFFAGDDYDYRRGDIGHEYYDFGTPKNRMVSVSSAKRISRLKSWDEIDRKSVIMFGDRDQPWFDSNLFRDIMATPANEPLNPSDIWTSQPRVPERLTTFDSGPGVEFAKVIKTNLPDDSIYVSVKSHKAVGDYGHYRGTFNNPKVIVFADPDGYDSLMTARAATGTRGQYLHGLVKNIVVDGEKVGDQYLVISTLPYGMDGATDSQWQEALGKTTGYRQALLNALVANSPSGPALILADGKYANQELKEFLQDSGLDTPLVYIEKKGLGNDSGLTVAIDNIRSLSNIDVHSTSVAKSNIPRTHLSYYARSWEGTCGDRVVAAPHQNKDKIFFMIAPDWVVDQKPVISVATKAGIAKLQQKRLDAKLPKINESVEQFLERTGQSNIDIAQ